MKKREKYDPSAGKPYLHPGRQANIIYDGEVVGYLGEVHPEVADTYGIGERAYIAVIDMPEILQDGGTRCGTTRIFPMMAMREARFCEAASRSEAD